MDKKFYDIFGNICIFILIATPFVLMYCIGYTYNFNNKQEFINYCKLYKNIKIIDNSYVKKNYVVRRNFIYFIHKYRIEEEDEKVKDVKLYFNDKLIYNLNEVPTNYISNNKITDCSNFYNEYVRDKED